jgi:predicted NBD/HSP70 family sugar kinase
MTYVLFDIGGTKTRIATSTDLLKFDEVKSYKTPSTFNDGMKKFTETVKEMTNDVTAIAGGIRGRLMEDKSGIENDGKLTKWAGESVVGYLQNEYGDIPVFLENDTAIAGVGEAVFGAGEGLEIIAYHTVSTGVGGAKIENGEIDMADVGFEPGHQILDIDRTIMGEDITPTLENMVSGTAVKDRMGVEPYEIPQTDVMWDDLAGYLAQGLRNTILYWSPDAIVLGGSMIIGDPAIKVDAIRKATAEALDGFEATPLIVQAKLGDEAGLYGGMAILAKRLEH